MAFLDMQYSITALPWLVWIVPIVGSLLVPLLGWLSDKVKGIFSVIVALASTVISLFMFWQLKVYTPQALSSSIAWIPYFGIEVGVLVDPLSCLFALLVGFVGTLVLVYSIGYMSGEKGLTRYYSIMLLFIGSMIGLIMADNLLQLFVFWEMVGFCSFILVGFWYERPQAVSSATQVLLMTKIGDVALLIAIILLYIDSGTFQIIELTGKVASLSSSVLVVSSLLFLFGSIAKSAQVPMHTWLFAAMEAPTTVSCLLHGATMVKAGVYLIARTHILFSNISIWTSALVWIGMTTAFLAAILALFTDDIKGVAAYSTISQIGYMMTGLGASTTSYSLGWFVSIYHLVNHAFFQGLGFLSAGIIVHQIGTRDLRKMGGLRHDFPVTFTFALVTFLSRAAIPPFGGFFSKEMLAETLLATQNLPLIVLFYSTSALTVAYSLRLILLVFVREKPEGLAQKRFHREDPLMILPAFIFAFISGILGILRDPMISFFELDLLPMHSEISVNPSFLHVLSLILGLIPVYLFYINRIPSPSLFEGSPFIFISRLLSNGFYFDEFYRIVVVRSTLLLSRLLNERSENFLCRGVPKIVAIKVLALASLIRVKVDTRLDQMCYLLAEGTMKGAVSVRDNVDDRLDRLCYLLAGNTMKGAVSVRDNIDEGLDRLSYTLAGRTVQHARGLVKSHTGLLPHFVLSVVLGISLLSTLLALAYYSR